jgi:hypothetical protein
MRILTRHGTSIVTLMLAVASIALCGAGSPAPAPSASPAPTVVTMICGSPLFRWDHDMPLPIRSEAGGVGIGQTFTVLAGPRTSNRGGTYIQIDVATIETDLPNDHYWILRDCALPTIR